MKEMPHTVLHTQAVNPDVTPPDTPAPENPSPASTPTVFFFSFLVL
jgi:hypothetical protein